MHISSFALLVSDYDQAIAYYTEKLGFELREDSPRENGKRWVLVAPPGAQTVHFAGKGRNRFAEPVCRQSNRWTRRFLPAYR